MRYIKFNKKDLILGAMLLISIVQLFVCYISWQSAIVAFILFLVAFRGRSKSEFTYLDIAISFALLFELILFFTTINSPPASTYVMMAFYTWSYYFICRFCLTSIRQFRFILLCLSIIIFIILIIGAVSFLQFRQQVYLSGFKSLYEFRSLLTPWGNTLNLWATFLTAFMGIILLTFLYYRNHPRITGFLTLTFALLIWNGLATFSRTLYTLFILAFLILTIGFAIKKAPKIKWVLTVYVMTIIGFCWTNDTHDVGTVLKINETISQQRSTNARIHAFSMIAHSLENNLAFGVGNGNYTLAINDELYENDDITYTNFASSGILQLVTEKGIIGSIVWIILILTFIVALLKCRSVDSILALIMVGMLILKETTFAVFADFPNLQCLYIIPIVGILNIQKKSASHSLPLKNPNYLPLAATTLFTLFYGIELHQIYLNNKNNELIENIDIRPEKTEKYLNLNIDSTPYLLNKAYILGKRYFKTESSNDYQATVHYLQQAITRNPLDNMPYYNLALLYIRAKQLPEAFEILQSLIQRCPNNSLFRIGLAQAFYQTRNLSASAHEYARAILINPPIMDDQQWGQLKENNHSFFALICDAIYELMSFDTDDPIQLAKNGKIFLELNEIPTAQSYLESSVMRLPYLSKAWYNLGLIAHQQEEYSKAMTCFRKALLFDTGNVALQQYLTNREKCQELKMSTNFLDIYTKSYKLKFRTWYRCTPYSTSVISPSIFIKY